MGNLIWLKTLLLTRFEKVIFQPNDDFDSDIEETEYITIDAISSNVVFSADNKAELRNQTIRLKFVQPIYVSPYSNGLVDLLDDTKIQWDMSFHSQDRETRLWYTIYEINLIHKEDQ